MDGDQWWSLFLFVDKDYEGQDWRSALEQIEKFVSQFDVTLIKIINGIPMKKITLGLVKLDNKKGK